jgi:2-hydroxy-6-oxonona-2,4-dienedioate hydrolase
VTNEVRVDTPKGRIFVREIPGEGPPLVLMHGFPDDHRIYDRLLPRLSPRRAVAFDFLGYGRSDRSDALAFTPAEHGEELAAVLDELGIDRAVLVGHDASGPDAVFFTVDHPERVTHLVLLNTIFGHQPSMTLPEMTRLFAEPELSELADDLMSDELQRLWVTQRWGVQWKFDPDDAEDVAQRSIIPQFFGDADQPDAIAAVRGWCARLHQELDVEDALIADGALRRLSVPVSIIFGDGDPYLKPALARELAQLFDRPSLHLVHDASHWVQHDRPEVVADLLQSI